MENGTILDCEVDRLSNLPDDLIYKILSYVDIVYCIRLSVLSSRLRFIRTSMPNLNFSRHKLLSESSRYHEIVDNVLSARNNNIDVSSVSVYLFLEDHKLVVFRILEYAFSHNVQQLSISSRYVEISPSQLSCKSLKHLTLFNMAIDCESDSTIWDLPALTTLHLSDVVLFDCSSIIAMCHNLKNLTLERCTVLEPEDSHGFTISNSKLLSLTLKKVKWHVSFVYVDSPQLKNLIFVDHPQREVPDDIERISDFSGELTISARGLTYLRIKGSYFPKLSLDGFPSLEKVDLCIPYPRKKNVHRIFDLFQRLHSVKSLALSLEIVKLLSTSEEVILRQPSPFPSLKSLKIYPSKGLKTLEIRDLKETRLKSSLEIFKTQPAKEQEAMKIKLLEVTNYLLGSSSNATFTMVSHEEARAIKITTVAYRLMAALWEILDEKEAYPETIIADNERKRTLADSCLEDFDIQIWPPRKVKVIFRILQNIKLLLTKAVASKRLEMQAYLSRLSAKTKIFMNKMLLDMKNQCDIQQCFFSGYLDKFAL